MCLLLGSGSQGRGVATVGGLLKCFCPIYSLGGLRVDLKGIPRVGLSLGLSQGLWSRVVVGV